MSDTLDSGFTGETNNPFEFPAQGGHFVANKTKYAWGLSWGLSSVADDEKPSKKKVLADARQSAESQSADLIVVNGGQYGLGAKQTDQAIGMRTVPTALIDRLGENFLAVFDLGGYFYYLAVVDSNVDAGSDARYANEDEIQAHFRNMLDLNEGGWQNIIAPASWNIPNSSDQTLEDTLRGSRSKARLVDATRKNLIKKLVVVTVIAGVSYGLYAGYNAWTAYEQQAQQQAQQERMARLQAMNHQKQIQMAKDMTWPYDNQPIGQYALAICQEAILTTPIILPGYIYTGSVCTPSTGEVKVSFKATEDGTYTSVVDSVNLLTKMHAHIDHNDDKIIITYDFSNAFKRHLFGRHNSYDNISNDWKWLDAISDSEHTKKFIQIKLTTPPATKQQGRVAGAVNNVTNKGATDIDKTVFKTLNITIDSPLTPLNWIKYFEPLRGMVIDSISYGGKSQTDIKDEYTIADFNWTINASVYEGILQSQIDKGAQK